MKVRNSLHFRSLTALLRSSIRNSSEPNEGCEPAWFEAVPSVTYFWTHRPQWRRRHKKRKLSNSPRSCALTCERLNDQDLLESLKIVERPLSRASTSPYETCSSRQIVVDSKSSRNYNDSDNHDDYDIPSSQQNREIDRNLRPIESRSDSGLRKSREQQIIRLIRSQRRLGTARNAANNGQAGTVTFSSVEVNRMVDSSERREFQLDCTVPKRRVTFDNSVSTESSIDTEIRKNRKNNNTDARRLLRPESYVRLSEDDDDDDDLSLQTDLEHLFSSTIFNLSSRSSLSITSSPILEKPKKTQSRTFRKTGESIFYVNSSYLRESSSDLLPVKKIFSIESYPQRDVSVLQEFDKNNTGVKVIKISKKNNAEHENTCNQFKKSLNKKNDSSYRRSIERMILELEHLTHKEMAPPFQRIIDHRSILGSSAPKNHISTDTSDLVELYRPPKLSQVSELPKRLMNNVGLNISEIIDLMKPPIARIDKIFPELSTVDKKIVTNLKAEKKIVQNAKKIREYESSESLSSGLGKIDLLRIETETDGEYESLFIELKDLDDDLRDSGLLDHLIPLKTENYSEPFYKPIVNESPQVRRNSELINSARHRIDHKSCSIDECCMICGRTKTDNPRYLRPVCRVKGATMTPRLENDPWINVMNRIIKNESGREITPQARRNHESIETSSRYEYPNNTEHVNQDNGININYGIVAHPDEEDPEVIEKDEMECFSVFVTETDNSISTDDSNGVGSRDQSTSCSTPESGLDSSSSFDSGTRLRGQLAKAYCTREPVRTANVTSNRLLCVISESDALMGLPQLLPKKAPDWFARQVPRRKSSRR